MTLKVTNESERHHEKYPGERSGNYMKLVSGVISSALPWSRKRVMRLMDL